jgi:hypothetical protein
VRLRRYVFAFYFILLLLLLHSLDIVFLFSSTAQLLMYFGGEHQIRRHIDPLIDQLLSALSLAYQPVPGITLTLILKFFCGDHLATGAMLCVRLGTHCSCRFHQS